MFEDRFWSVTMKKNLYLVCVLRVCMVTFTILCCIIQNPFIGGIFNWKLKPENKPEVKLLHSYDCLYSFLLLKFSMDVFSFMFLHILTANGMFATPLGSSNRCLALAFIGGFILEENLNISVGCQEKLEELVSH